MASSGPRPVPSKLPKPAETRPARARRYYRGYQSHARAVRNAGTRAAARLPATDTFGTAFKMMTIAGLIGLGILHPDAVSGMLGKATATIRTVITGGK